MGFSGSRRPARASLIAERQRFDRLVLAEHHALERRFEILQHLGIVLGDVFGGMRAILATTSRSPLVPMVFLRRFLGGDSCCAAPASSITSIALSGSLRSLM